MLIRTHRVLVLLAVLLAPGFLNASALAAQDLREGALIRLHRHEPPPLTGRVRLVSADTVWLRIGSVTQPIARTAIHRLELLERETRMRSGWSWAKRGLVAGAVLGGVTCLADQENCASDLGPNDGLTEGLLSVSMFYGVGVAFMGFKVGVAIPAHRWVDIPLPIERPPPAAAPEPVGAPSW